MSTGADGRCDIFRRIDALDRCRNFQEFVKAVKPILNALAYDSVAGDASVAAYQEEWHDQYTSALYEEAGAEIAAAAAAKPPVQPKAATKPTPQKPSPAAQARPQALRPRPAASSIPASLQSIMDGTHPSLHED